ncbi:MAG: hypothetical protein NXI35_38405 [bacterium]|nr:hypothetical protein [bacterium]
MDTSKLENFRRSYPGQPFPEFAALTAAECETLRKKVAATLGLSDGDPLELVRHLHAQTGNHLGEVPRDGQPDLRALVEGVPIGRPHRVFVNWYRFDDIDSLDLDALSRHFDDIWYPSVDDIEVFDDSCRWFLSVSHDGRMTLIQP